MATDFDNECFFIAPIGEDGGDIRKRSDEIRDWVVGPAAEAAAGLKTVRADDVGEPGQITAQAIQHCLKAKAAVADLTEGNPNVYYELSVRHGAQLPVVLIAEEGTDLPFDISQSRVIFFNHTALGSAGRAKREIETQIEASLASTPENPISDGMRLAQLQAGDAEGQALAQIANRLDGLSGLIAHMDNRLRRAERRGMIKSNVGRPRSKEEVGEIQGRIDEDRRHREELEDRRRHMVLNSEEEMELRAQAEADQALFDPGEDPESS